LPRRCEMCQHPGMRAAARTSYHHGDLAEALTAAGLAVCRDEGPGQLAIRDLAARVGVSPTAAYRHFPSLEHLRAAVSQRAREELARRLEIAIARETSGRTAADRSRRRLRASGAAYLAFALEEPHLFDTAFAPCDVDPSRPDDPDAWQVLNAVLDEMVAAGAMPAARRAEAPWIAWSAIHGLASILTRSSLVGPLDRERTLEAILDGVDRALRS
jgi:AcrR family transcriptional regulator